MNDRGCCDGILQQLEALGYKLIMRYTHTMSHTLLFYSQDK